MNGTAKLSDCGTYRYRLTRVLFDGEGSVNFIMLNPSTADATVDDPTIRRCTRYTKDWGYAELVVTNLYALRATDPRMLLRYGEPIGPENDAPAVPAGEPEAGGVGQSLSSTLGSKMISSLRPAARHGLFAGAGSLPEMSRWTHRWAWCIGCVLAGLLGIVGGWSLRAMLDGWTY